MREQLESRLEKLGRRGHRALSAAIARDGERVFGGWSVDGKQPDAFTLFEIGSITKVFTGVLLADMHLRGEVSLEDSLSAYVPAPRPAWRHREPTLLELATHRSALPNTPRKMGRRELAYMLGLRRKDPWAAVTDAEYARLVSCESPRRTPGEGIRYSSMGVGLLGDALAARAGSSYEDLLRERILIPLGMSATAIAVGPEGPGKLIGGHSRRGHPRPPLQDFMPAAGSLRSNADDMLRFLTACLSPPAQSPGPALVLAQQPQARIRKRLEIGLCWMIFSAPRAPKVVWHNGGTWGFRSFAGFAPEPRTAAILMSNTSRSVDRAGFELIKDLPQLAAEPSAA
ncbi:MAG TPA: serine hydrolase domain-containing protein [Solirubrobacteraceae bacterium]|nr:serine hydrolase domain-containing protein [Solirubrobacteraceae bacterium]